MLGPQWRVHLEGLAGLGPNALDRMKSGARPVPQGLSLVVAMMKIVDYDVLDDREKVEALGEFLTYDDPSRDRPKSDTRDHKCATPTVPHSGYVNF